MKIISWNIANYNDHPHWEERVKLLAKEIAEHDPDVIALQEVRYDKDAPSTVATGWNTAEQLLSELYKLGCNGYANLAVEPAMYYNYRFQSAFLRFLAKDVLDRSFWEGLSVISKEPIIESTNYILNPYPPDEDSNIRNVQMVRTGEYTIFNTHLSYSEDEALNNAHKLVEYIKHQNYDNSILCGDFNTTKGDDAIKIIEQNGFISVGSDAPTFPTKAPGKKIDFFFASPLLKDKAKTVTLLGTDCDENGIYPSDHIGLLLEL
ncbi:MAG: endonuclease/exonuclease/phosphatase family protein [Candidatus Zophobacter franzmannii]|nr:endonuclease/exonuclease/phosphatase family protein [Candidatus Zophobacter franzmannii]